jgi:hypothetical protein
MAFTKGKTQKPLFIATKNKPKVEQPGYGTDMRKIEDKVNGLNSAATTVTARVTIIEGEITTIDGEITTLQTEVATLESQNPTHLPLLVHIVGGTHPWKFDTTSEVINLVAPTTVYTVAFHAAFPVRPFVIAWIGDSTAGTSNVETIRKVEATTTTTHFAFRYQSTAFVPGSARRITWFALAPA